MVNKVVKGFRGVKVVRVILPHLEKLRIRAGRERAGKSCRRGNFRRRLAGNFRCLENFLSKGRGKICRRGRMVKKNPFSRDERIEKSGSSRGAPASLLQR